MIAYIRSICTENDGQHHTYTKQYVDGHSNCATKLRVLKTCRISRSTATGLKGKLQNLALTLQGQNEEIGVEKNQLETIKFKAALLSP